MKRFIVEFGVILALVAIVIGGFISIKQANAGNNNSFVDENGVHVLGIVCVDKNGVKADKYHILDGKCYQNEPSIVPSQEPSVVPSLSPSTAPSSSPSATPTAVPSVEPSVIPTAQPTQAQANAGTGNVQSNASTNTNQAPTCGEPAITKASTNFHILRKGDQAIAKWWPNADANKATIYYKQVNSGDWQYSITTDNTGYVEINGLGSMDITFALQEHKNCGGGGLTEPVIDGNTSNWVLFR